MHKNPNIQSFCSWEDEISCKLLTRNAFLIYVLSTQDPKVNQDEIPLIYQTYKNVFEKENVDILFKQQPYNCAVDLEEGAWPLFGPIYNFSQDELMTFQESIDENINKIFIWHSKSLVATLILFVKKKNGFLWMLLIIVNYVNSPSITNTFYLWY